MRWSPRKRGFSIGFAAPWPPKLTNTASYFYIDVEMHRPAIYIVVIEADRVQKVPESVSRVLLWLFLISTHRNRRIEVWVICWIARVKQSFTLPKLSILSCTLPSEFSLSAIRQNDLLKFSVMLRSYCSNLGCLRIGWGPSYFPSVITTIKICIILCRFY